jgi:hypothetical protein
MKIKTPTPFATFNDGIGDVYQVIDRRVKKLRQRHVHYGRASVGERRFWDAQVAGKEINMVIEVPTNTLVSQHNLFVIKGVQYTVLQKDYKDDKLPDYYKLTLQTVGAEYRDAEVRNANQDQGLA